MPTLRWKTTWSWLRRGRPEMVQRGFEHRIVDSLKDIPVRMISYGDNCDISFVLRRNDKKESPSKRSTAASRCKRNTFPRKTDLL